MGPITGYVGIVQFMSQSILTMPQIVRPSGGPLEQVIAPKFWSKRRSQEAR